MNTTDTTDKTAPAVMMGDDDFDAAKLDPGVRRLVTWLRGHGFKTTDSGDGKTKREMGWGSDGECGVCDFPHVAMVVEPPDKLVIEARRLAALLIEEHDIMVFPLTHEQNDNPRLDVSYELPLDIATLVLMHVDDSMLVTDDMAPAEATTAPPSPPNKRVG